MTKAIVAAAALTVLFAAGAVAQAQAQDRRGSEDACGRDGTRYCKAVINDGDMAILACLRQNRAKLRPVCLKYLQEKGQL